jgi:alkylation response protein AidB-like acyl-CoA dehydrogenase
MKTAPRWRSADSPLRKQGWSVMIANIELEKVIITGGYLGTPRRPWMRCSRSPRHGARPVGTFQALAHAMADLQVEIDSARLLAYRAAWLPAQGQPCGRDGSMAKLKGSETYVAAARLGMQVCAGHGFSTESVMSFRYRESIVATISGGTSQIQRNGIARSMGLRTLWVPTISSTSCDQAVFVDHATDASLSSYAVLAENHRLW